jgi:hypothetical protein
MSAIRALKNMLAAKNEEFSKKSRESWKLLEEIARLQAEHEGVRYQMNRISMEVEELNQKLDTLDYPRPVWAESKQQEPEAQILASVTPAPVPLAEPVVEPQRSEMAVFATVAHHDIKKGRVTVADFKDLIACSYQLAVDCAEPFRTKSEKKFKEQIKAVQKIDGSGLVGGSAAKKVHSFMKSGTENIGKVIVVAYDKGIGGGGEVRRITGPYRYSPMNTFQQAAARASQHDTIACYFHRFPTAFIRNLTPDEFNKVASTRPPRAINWTTRLLL